METSKLIFVCSVLNSSKTLQFQKDLLLAFNFPKKLKVFILVNLVGKVSRNCKGLQVKHCKTVKNINRNFMCFENKWLEMNGFWMHALARTFFSTSRNPIVLKIEPKKADEVLDLLGSSSNVLRMRTHWNQLRRYTVYIIFFQWSSCSIINSNNFK